MCPYKDFSLQTVHLKITEVVLMIQAPKGVCLSLLSDLRESVMTVNENFRGILF